MSTEDQSKGHTGSGSSPGDDGAPRRGRFSLAPVEPRGRSWIWFALPAFIGVLGGAIAYWALRPDTPRMARDCLYLGILTTIVGMAPFVILISGLAAVGPDAWTVVDDDYREGEMMRDMAVVGKMATMENPERLVECLEDSPGFDGSTASLDPDSVKKCLGMFAAHTSASPPG